MQTVCIPVRMCAASPHTNHTAPARLFILDDARLLHLPGTLIFTSAAAAAAQTARASAN